MRGGEWVQLALLAACVIAGVRTGLVYGKADRRCEHSVAHRKERV